MSFDAHGPVARRPCPWIAASSDVDSVSHAGLSEPQFVGALAHEANHVGDVLVERQTELVGARRRSSRFTARANALSFIRLITDAASRSRTLLLGRTSAAAVTNPAISSHANSVCSSRDSRGTPL